MTSCTIIISHYESLNFLRACVRQIRKHKHPEIEQYIIIADQSGKDTAIQIMDEFNGEDIVVVHTKPLWSGYGIDYLMRDGGIETDYICQLHVDAFSISDKWLLLPIKLIEENNFAFVGQLHFISDGKSSIYPPGRPFFSMSPTFNVARTETYKEMALQAGFTRFHNRTTDFHNKIPMDFPMTFANNDWELWAKEDYYNRGSDDDTVAFCWEDTYRQHNKLGLAITGRIGVLGREPDFGRVIDDLVFHFGSCREAISILSKMGNKYQEYTKKIKDGYSDELVEELLSMVKPIDNPPRISWDRKTKTHPAGSRKINKRIEILKNSCTP